MKFDVVKLEVLRTYLSDNGWSLEDFNNFLFKIKKTYKGTDYEFLLPTSEDLEDYSFRIGKILSTISLIDGKSKHDLYEELTSKGFDVLKFRFKSNKTKEGTFPLEELEKQHELKVGQEFWRFNLHRSGSRVWLFDIERVECTKVNKLSYSVKWDSNNIFNQLI